MNLKLQSTKLDELFEKIEMNHIYCDAGDWKKFTSKSLKKKIDKSPTIKFIPNRIITFYLPNLTNEALENYSFKFHFFWEKYKQELIDELTNIAQQGENKYELNFFIRTQMNLIDEKISNLNLENWFDSKKPAEPNSNRVFMGLPSEKQYVAVSSIHIDILSGPGKYLLEMEFKSRIELLQKLQAELVKIYSKYLFLPSIVELPQLDYDGTAIDIIEVLEAWRIINPFKMQDQFETFKAIILKLFNIKSKTFETKKASVYSREKGGAFFINQLKEAAEKNRKVAYRYSAKIEKNKSKGEN